MPIMLELYLLQTRSDCVSRLCFYMEKWSFRGRHIVGETYSKQLDRQNVHVNIKNLTLNVLPVPVLGAICMN